MTKQQTMPMKSLLTFLIAATGCVATVPTQRPTVSLYDVAEHEKHIVRTADLTTGDTIRSISYYATARGVRGYWSLNEFTFEAYLIDTGEPSFLVQAILRYPVSEWPVDDTLSLVIDGIVYRLPMRHLEAKNFSKISGSTMLNDVSLSTTESQILRMEGEVDRRILDTIASVSEVWFVFHSGHLPVSFRLDEKEVITTVAFVKPVNVKWTTQRE